MPTGINHETVVIRDTETPGPLSPAQLAIPAEAHGKPHGGTYLKAGGHSPRCLLHII